MKKEEKIKLWKKLFVTPDCRPYTKKPCESCCWECEFLPKCYSRWPEEDGTHTKETKIYCQVRQDERWCSAAQRAYRKYLLGEQG